LGGELVKTEARIILNRGKREWISEKENSVHDIEYWKTDNLGDCSVLRT